MVTAVSEPLRDLRRGWNLRGDSVAIQFSSHAITRFAERVRPTLDADHIREELSRLLGTATVSRTPPDWVRPGSGKITPAAYLVLGDGEICLPLVVNHGADGEWTATTTLLPDIVEGQQRAGRNQRAQARRAGKKASRRVQSRQGGRRQQAPSADEWDPQ